MMGFPDFRLLVCGALALALAACAETQLVANSTKLVTVPAAPPRTPVYKIGKPYQLEGVWYYPKVDYSYDESGIASWYGPDFNGKPTASGEIYDQNGLTAAHRTLPMPTIIQITNLENGRSLKLRVNDRGPFAHGRIVDVSQRAAQLLGFIEQGTARVRVQVIADESQALAAALSGGTMVPEGEPPPPAPTAAPTVPVTEANLTTLNAKLPPSTGSPATVASSAVVAGSGSPSPAATPTPTPTPAPAPATTTTLATTAPSLPSAAATASPAITTHGAVAPPGTPSIQLDKPRTTAATPIPTPPAPTPTPSAGASSVVTPSTPTIAATTTQTAATPSVTPAPAAVSSTTLPTPAPAPTTSTPAPAASTTVAATAPAAQPTAGYEPSGKVTQVPVKPSSIFIQAGAFTKKKNAETLTAELQRLGHTTMVPVKIGGQQFYRVRLGPLTSVTEADRLLEELVRSGHPEARIVVD